MKKKLMIYVKKEGKKSCLFEEKNDPFFLKKPSDNKITSFNVS